MTYNPDNQPRKNCWATNAARQRRRPGLGGAPCHRSLPGRHRCNPCWATALSLRQVLRLLRTPSMELPTPGGPSSSMWWPPAAQISARLATGWLTTSARSPGELAFSVRVPARPIRHRSPRPALPSQARPGRRHEASRSARSASARRQPAPLAPGLPARRFPRARQPGEPGGRSGGDRRQHPWYGTNPAVMAKLAKEDRPGKAVLRQHSVRRQNRHSDAHSATTALCPRCALAWGPARAGEIVPWLSISRRSQP